MRNVLAVCAAVGGLLLGCDGAGNRASSTQPPAAAPKAEASASKKVSEVLIRYCSS
jgi:hypothetical protein